MTDVLEFQGEHRWLSNFAPVTIRLHDGDYPSVEHAYQAEKTMNDSAREEIRRAKTPEDAKRLGRHVPVRRDWEFVKVDVMRHLLSQKFCVEPYRSKLVATGTVLLIEGNRWGDTFWGVQQQSGCGLNMLGKLIMDIRAELIG